MFACGLLDCSLSLYLSEKSSRCAAFLGPLPKRRFHSHPQAKPGTFDTKMATCYVLDPDDFTEK